MLKQLFIFAVLSNMKDMAVLFLRYGTDATAKVLLARKIYSRMKELHFRKSPFKVKKILDLFTENEM